MKSFVFKGNAGDFTGQINTWAKKICRRKKKKNEHKINVSIFIEHWNSDLKFNFRFDNDNKNQKKILKFNFISKQKSNVPFDSQNYEIHLMPFSSNLKDLPKTKLIWWPLSQWLFTSLTCLIWREPGCQTLLKTMSISSATACVARDLLRYYSINTINIPVKILSYNYIRYNCQGIYSWSRRPKNIMKIRK